MPNDISIPPVRSDVTVADTGNTRFPWALVDPLRGATLGLDAIGRAVVQALSRPRTAVEVLGVVHQSGEGRLEPGLLFKHVGHLARSGFLEGARAARLRRLHGAPSEAEATTAAAELPFDYLPGLQHACQACGSCCSATDVGPIPRAVADEILKVDWTRHIDGLERKEDVFRRGSHEGREILLTAMRHDQCIFLGSDKLCLVHKTIGMAKKPTPCRQFPYVFARTGDRVSVSLQMECRAYWKAKQAAAPMAEGEDELRELLRSGAPVHVVPDVIPLDAGFTLSRDEYLALERTVVEAVRAADPKLGPYAPLVGLGRGIDAALSALMDDVSLEEAAYLEPAAWRRVFPGAAGADVDPWENFLRELSRFCERVDTFTREGAEVAAERKLPWLAQRLDLFGRAVKSLSDEVEPGSFRASDTAAVRGVLEDLIVSALFAKEAVRRTGTLRLGLALVGFRALVTFHGACRRAKEACRVEVHTQDVIDTMVTISKMLRERAVVDLLSELEKPLISLFSTNLEVFAHESAPRLHAPGGLR